MRAVLDTHCLCAQSSIPTTYARSIRYTLLTCAIFYTYYLLRAILDTHCLCTQSRYLLLNARSIRYTLLMCVIFDTYYLCMRY